MSRVSNGGNIYWLASYPKSGSTWFRTFLKNLLEDGDEPVSIDELAKDQGASSRSLLDDVLGFDSADLYQNEIDRLRPSAYKWISELAGQYVYYKIHDTCWQIDFRRWLISVEATAGALYFIRNPLDVAISYAHHNSCTIDQAIGFMAEAECCFYRNRHKALSHQTEQYLLTWSKHVESWVDNPVINTHVVRYEDMKNQPQQTFTKAVNYLNLPSSFNRVAKALYFSDFRILQKQEAEHKFCERPVNAKQFFRKGIAGDWQETLSIKQIDRVIYDHHEVMLRFGYLDTEGNPQVM